VQPHSGSTANMSVYFALFEPGHKLMGMKLDQGGHLTHGSPVNFSGKFYEFVSYGVTESDERLDYDQIADLAAKERPKAIIAGATAYPRLIDPEPLRRICDEIGALFIFDAAHVAGLVVGGVHPDPVPDADVVTFTTHKTLRGPRGAAIVCKEQYAQAIDKAVITLNENTVPNDPRPPFQASGLRIGTAAETTAGMGEQEMPEIASLIGRALRGRDDDGELESVRDAVATLCSKFTPYPGT